MAQVTLEVVRRRPRDNPAVKVVAQRLPLVVALPPDRAQILQRRDVRAEREAREVLVQIANSAGEPIASVDQIARACFEVVSLIDERVDRTRARRSQPPQRIDACGRIELTQLGLELIDRSRQLGFCADQPSLDLAVGVRGVHGRCQRDRVGRWVKRGEFVDELADAVLGVLGGLHRGVQQRGQLRMPLERAFDHCSLRTGQA